ncbi:MAG: F0F1 ATP synthase subunit A [Phycisphaeraceae bacterium]|nr:F0F1 ATP synthase subunit A [Phycisphaeraceae bacterium]
MILSTLVLAASDPVGHVANHRFAVTELFGFKDFWLWSGHVGNLVLSGLVCILVGLWAASKIGTGPESQGPARYVTRNPFAHMLEVICVYLRENTVRPLLGARTDTFMPFLWTLFFFILVNNLLGLVPFTDMQHLASSDMKAKGLAFVGGTATQSIFVTGVLAAVSFLVVNAAGIRELGLVGYLKHLTGGAPVFIWPILVPVEILGTFIKPIALAIRLFANMTAGHILMATLFIFAATGIATVAKGGVGLGAVVTLASVAGAIAINFLELFVAVLQAYVFMFLTTVFISQLSHHHDHEHDEAHGHEHAHA